MDVFLSVIWICCKLYELCPYKSNSNAYNLIHYKSLVERTSDTLIGYLPIFQMLPKTSLSIRYHWCPF